MQGVLKDMQNIIVIMIRPFHYNKIPVGPTHYYITVLWQAQEKMFQFHYWNNIKVKQIPNHKFPLHGCEIPINGFVSNMGLSMIPLMGFHITIHACRR